MENAEGAKVLWAGVFPAASRAWTAPLLEAGHELLSRAQS